MAPLAELSDCEWHHGLSIRELDIDGTMDIENHNDDYNCDDDNKFMMIMEHHGESPQESLLL
jgi:hypothetical protein